MTDHIACPEELLSFQIGDQEYCMDIMSVREIRGWTPETPLPEAPPFVRGIINLRGAAIPVVDLAARLGLPQVVPSSQSVMIVAQIGDSVVGLLVSAVCDIINGTSIEVQPVPGAASLRARGFVAGLLTVEGRMVALLRTEDLIPEMAEAA